MHVHRESSIWRLLRHPAATVLLAAAQVSWAEVVQQLETKQRLAEVVSDALQRFQAAEAVRVQRLQRAPPEEADAAEKLHGTAVEAFTSFLRVRLPRPAKQHL